MTINSCNARTWEGETEGSSSSSATQWFQGNLDCLEHCLKDKLETAHNLLIHFSTKQKNKLNSSLIGTIENLLSWLSDKPNVWPLSQREDLKHKSSSLLFNLQIQRVLRAPTELVLLGTFQVLTVSRKSFKLMSPTLLWCVQFLLLLSPCPV